MPPDLKILVIDDDQVFCTFFKAFFKQTFEVHTTCDPLEGLKKVELEPYDLIFTDFSMPEMTGKEVITRIRNLGVSIPIIICTSSEFDPEEPLDWGANAYLRKPLTDSLELINLVHLHIAKRSKNN